MRKFLLGSLFLPLTALADVVWTPTSTSVSDWFNWESNGTAIYQNTEQEMKILLSVKSGKNQSAGVGFNWQEEGAVKSLSGSGVCLTYRSSQPFRLDMSQSTITDSDFWGIKVPASETYKALYIPFTSLAQEGWGKKVSWSLNNHKGMQFSYKGNYAKTDSSLTLDILQIGLGNVCDTTNIPVAGKVVSSTTPFWNSASETPASSVNTFGAAFSTYVTESSEISSVQEFLSTTGSVGFNATLKGTGYPTAGLKMPFDVSDSFVDISKESGLCVAYRSNSGVRLQLIQEGIALNNGNYFGFDLKTVDSYTIVEMPFASFSQEQGWGYDAVLDLKRITALQFELKGKANKTGDIEILQLGFTGSCKLPKFAPVLMPPYTETENATLYEGDTLKYALKSMFTDKDDDSLNIIYSIEPNSGILIATKKNDTLTIVPKANISGGASLAILATDKDSQMAIYTNNITIVDRQNPPTGVNDRYEVLEDSVLSVSKEKGILVNDTDFDGDIFSINSYTTPTNGYLELADDGSFVYTPNADFSGVDSWTYTLTDSIGISPTVTVSIVVKDVNDKPTVTGTLPNLDSLEEDFASKIVHVNKSEVIFADKETATENLQYSVSTNGLVKASLTQNATQFIIALFPELNKNGTAIVTLYAKDSAGDSVGVSFEVEILPVSDAPIANDDSYNALEDSTLTIAIKNGVLTNDEDPDGNSELFVFLVDSTIHGSLTLNSDGSFVYTPNEDFIGTDSFTYIVKNESNVSSEQATVTISVLDRNDGPIVVAVVDTLNTTVKEDYTGTLKYTKAQIKSWFEDPEGDALYYSAENPDGKLNISWTTGGYMNIKVAKDSCGKAIVNVIATDSIEGTKPAVLSFVIDITPVNDLPKVLHRDTIVVEASGWQQEIELDSLFSDVDGDTLTYVVTSSNNSLIVEIENSILLVRPKNESIDLAAGIYRIRVGAIDAADTTVATIVFDVGGTTGFEKSLVNAQKSWKHSLQNAKGSVKLLDLTGRVLFSKNAPVLENEISDLIDNSCKPMILKTNLGVWKLAPKF
jgi:VCBS repeat-containing protein